MLTELYYRLQLRYLMAFDPVRLFTKINALDWYSRMLQQWVDELKLRPGSEVLELGCANGSLSAYLADAACKVTGADLSPEMIAAAKRQHPDIRFQVADVHELAFAPASFDAIIATSLINIVDDRARAMGEMARCCKPGGTVSILVPCAGFSDQDLQALHASLHSRGFSFAALEAWHRNPPKMQRDEIIDLFEQAGLAEISCATGLQGMVISASATKPL